MNEHECHRCSNRGFIPTGSEGTAMICQCEHGKRLSEFAEKAQAAYREYLRTGEGLTPWSQVKAELGL